MLVARGKAPRCFVSASLPGGRICRPSMLPKTLHDVAHTLSSLERDRRHGSMNRGSSLDLDHLKVAGIQLSLIGKGSNQNGRQKARSVCVIEKAALGLVVNQIL